jgi:hypothetical protein
MQKTIELRLLPHEAADPDVVKRYLAAAAGIPYNKVTGFYTLRHSLDARGRTIWVNLEVNMFVGEPPVPRPMLATNWKMVAHSNQKVIIIGAGPAGLFAALECLLQGLKPVVLERGKDVRARRRDLAAINKQGEVNPESNYCFGEGGAGTYSDGKLYTRSHKRGDVQKILQLFVQFGADERILYEAHPHIGTNKLPHIITAMRQHILDCGGEIHFDTRVIDFIADGNSLTAVKTADGTLWQGGAFVLATGHSARDVFELFVRRSLLVEAKPFALGVRIEHPQELIDACQYHLPLGSQKNDEPARGQFLPPASYSLVHQAGGRGVFSFCMCPGGIIAPAATNPGEIVVNGWSPSKRNNPFANSGMVTEIRLTDLVWQPAYKKLMGISPAQLQSPLGMMYLQQLTEKLAFEAGGGRLVAPAQRVEDFIQQKISANLPGCSYLPGIASADLETVLPAFVAEALREGLKAFGKKMKGYRTNEAVVVATESRTSSPVRIPRHKLTLQHPQLTNLYPCAEGAGYAGGIVSAAMDGEKVVKCIAAQVFGKEQTV